MILTLTDKAAKLADYIRRIGGTELKRSYNPDVGTVTVQVATTAPHSTLKRIAAEVEREYRLWGELAKAYAAKLDAHAYVMPGASDAEEEDGAE